jgi:hypothetical protein
MRGDPRCQCTAGFWALARAAGIKLLQLDHDRLVIRRFACAVDSQVPTQAGARLARCVRADYAGQTAAPMCVPTDELHFA